MPSSPPIGPAIADKHWRRVYEIIMMSHGYDFSACAFLFIAFESFSLLIITLRFMLAGNFIDIFFYSRFLYDLDGIYSLNIYFVVLFFYYVIKNNESNSLMESIRRQ